MDFLGHIGSAQLGSAAQEHRSWGRQVGPAKHIPYISSVPPQRCRCTLCIYPTRTTDLMPPHSTWRRGSPRVCGEYGNIRSLANTEISSTLTAHLSDTMNHCSLSQWRSGRQSLDVSEVHLIARGIYFSVLKHTMVIKNVLFSHVYTPGSYFHCFSMDQIRLRYFKAYKE